MRAQCHHNLVTLHVNTCPSLPEAKLSAIETKVKYLRQTLDYRSLHEVGVWRLFCYFMRVNGYLMRFIVRPPQWI